MEIIPPGILDLSMLDCIGNNYYNKQGIVTAVILDEFGLKNVTDLLLELSHCSVRIPRAKTQIVCRRHDGGSLPALGVSPPTAL